MLTILTLGAAAIGQAAATVPRWEVANDPMVCYLRSINRPAGEQNVLFEVKPLAQGIELVLVGKLDLPKRETKATIRASSWTVPINATYHPTTLTGNFAQSVRITWTDFQRLAATPEVELKVADKPSVALSLSGLAKGGSAVNQCTNTILKGIGYVPNEPTPVPPGGYEPNPPKLAQMWIDERDFKGSAFAKERSGKTLLGWIVGRDGRVRNCTPLVSVGVEAVGPAACAALTKRALYTPRTDKDGKPVEVFYSRWVFYVP